ncbi:hypothetical protein N0V83_009859 [Neocucurbitaria cava]|uniref:Uncharacterized protein n=1 Tax=Neocucurbitaria cava TaxID=798079 RepID=A0A9W8Y260_9PLEO|nr:hypothetical protein N0V83_009859 [Neocucurbitaria cava]
MDNLRNVSQLRILQRQYFQLVEPHLLRWPDDATLKVPEVQSWLFTNLFDTDRIASPPPDRYQHRVLKVLISKLEASINDTEEDHLAVAGIVATDGDEAVVDAIKTNIFLNGLDTNDSTGCQVRTAALKWGWPVDATTFSEDYGMEAPDVLLGADVTYDKSVIPRLAATLREFFELNPALQVLISATIRNEQTFETFLNACRRNGFSFEQIDFPPVQEHLQGGPFYPTSVPIQIWRVTKRQAAKDPFAY